MKNTHFTWIIDFQFLTYMYAFVAKIINDMWKKCQKNTIFNFQVEYLSNENPTQKSETLFLSSIFCLNNNKFCVIIELVLTAC